jgi:hypothetical protein
VRDEKFFERVVGEGGKVVHVTICTKLLLGLAGKAEEKEQIP